MSRPFRNREAAGQALALRLGAFKELNTLVLGVPRGGVVVAAEVAVALEAPLDVIMARKLGAPHEPELAIGAVVSGGQRLLDEPTLRYLAVPAEYVEQETRRQLAEIDRRLALYRQGRPAVEVAGKNVVLVDDGIATGYTIRAALVGLRNLDATRLIVAVPVAPPATCADLRRLADEVICLHTPEPFLAVGAWYDDFEQNTDGEVIRLLARAESGRRAPGQVMAHGDETQY